MQHPVVRFPFVNRLTRFLPTSFAASSFAAAIFAIAILATTTLTAYGQTFSTVYTFPGGSKGSSPISLIFTPSGSLIGTAYYGTNCACYLIFSLSPGTGETVLHRFSVPFGDEAEIPGGYVISSNGETLYGLSSYGGNYTACPEGLGCGFVFSVDLTSGKYTLLHQFQGGPGDGADPNGNLALDSAGNLYGMAFSGGTNYRGAIFEITAANAESLIYSFGTVPDGTEPAGGLVRDAAGNLFGATISGGTGTCQNGPGCGTVFEVTPSGKETVLYSFTGGLDGQNPYLLVGDSSGDVYGVSRNADNVVIAVFEVNSEGQFSIVYNGSYVSDFNQIILGNAGTIYAIGSTAGTNGDGEIFQLIPTGGGEGAVTVLHAFDGTDGSYPQSLVMKGSAVYGSTAGGGSTGDGTIFKLTH